MQPVLPIQENDNTTVEDDTQEYETPNNTKLSLHSTTATIYHLAGKVNNSIMKEVRKDKGSYYNDMLKAMNEPVTNGPEAWLRDYNDERAIRIIGPWHKRINFYMDVRTKEVFRVDTDTDILTEADMAKHWHLVEAADRKELQSFVDNAIFKLINYFLSNIIS